MRCAGEEAQDAKADDSQNESVESGVQLVLSSDEIEPTTTFELRFEDEIISADQIGFPPKQLPLVIEPSLKGSFEWLSRRSGVFTPSEPPALGTTYQFSLAQNLRKADGKPLDAKLSRVLKTPPMQIIGTDPNNARTDDEALKDESATPKIHLQFNADVSPDGADKFIFFRNADGAKIPALAKQGTIDSSPHFDFQRLRGWKQRFDEARGSRGKQIVSANESDENDAKNSDENDDDDNENDSKRNVSSRLDVIPAQPLSVSEGWSLIVAKDFPSSDGATHLPEDFELKIGDVKPFTLDEVSTHNTIDSGRSINIVFSKTLSPEVMQKNARQWISIEPEPPHAEFVIGEKEIDVTGDFDLEKHYIVEVKAGLPAREPFALADAQKREVAFTPMPSRLYFPAFSTAQLNGGEREFQLHVLNTNHVLVRAKVLSAETLIYALSGYKSYFKKSNEPKRDGEPFREVDFAGVPGRVVFEKRFDIYEKSDSPKTLTLKWDDILGKGKTGAVFLAAERPVDDGERATLGTEALVQLTDIGLLWKQSDADEALVYAFSHTSGEPIANASLRVLSADNVALATQTTGTDGLAHFQIPKKARWLLAQNGDDLYAIDFRPTDQNDPARPFEERFIPLWHFHLPQYGGFANDEGEQHKALIFCDRPVYQPGEIFHFKAIARDPHGGDFAVPASLAGHVEFFDAKNQKFAEKNFELSRDGSLSESITLPQSPLGEYNAQIYFDDEPREPHSLEWRVEQYKPNVFAISIGAKDSYAPDEPINVPVSARYFFGKPLSKAKLRWSLTAVDEDFSPNGFDDFEFRSDIVSGSDDDEENSGGTALHLQGEMDLDENGAASLKPEIPIDPKNLLPRNVDLLVEITDVNQQTISERKTFIKQSSDFYLGVKMINDVLGAGDPAPVALIAVNPDGKPHEPQIDVTVRLQKIDWHVIREQGAGGAPMYRDEPELALKTEKTFRTRALEKSGENWKLAPLSPENENDGEEKNASFLKVDEPGDYLLEAFTKDSGGRVVRVATRFSVSSKPEKRAETTWPYRNEAQIDLVPDKQIYVAGESASILVKTPISGEALVTVEREKVLRAFVAKLDGNAPTIRVPLEADDAPNVYVSVMLLRGFENSPRKIKMPDYRLGYCEVKVERPDRKLIVKVAPDAPNYRPGKTVNVSAEIKDATGAPAADAEVTLYAVDEGVLSLMGYTTPDPFAEFYKPRSLLVETGFSLPSLLPEDPEQLEFSNKGYLIGGGGDEAMNERVRKNFLACAFWNAEMRTDSSGKITASFIAPDSLTRYRIIAVAQTAKSQFGSGESSFEINKPLMLEPALPRFGNVGDKPQLRAVLHNTTDAAGEVELSVDLGQNAVLTNSDTNVYTQKIQISARGTASADFPIEFKQAGEAKWTWRARMADPQNAGQFFSDSVETKLNVGYVAPLLHETLLARVSGTQTNLLAKANPQFLEGSGKFTARISNTRLSELNDAVSHLLHYPYGCVEQTTSSMIPWLMIGDLQNAIPALRVSPNEVDAAISRGVSRLLEMQTQSGGLAFWPGDREPMLWASAYGGVALALAQRGGHPFPVAMLDHVCDYLSKQLRNTAEKNDNYELSDRCLAVYALALAGRAEAAYHEILFKKRDRLSAENRALLALAILETHGDAASNAMVEELINPKKPSPPQGDVWFGSGTRELAVRLLAWTLHKPDDLAVDTLVEELNHARGRGGNWRTTQENAWSIMAFARYANAVERGPSVAEASLRYGENDADAENFRLDETTHVFEKEHAIAPSMPPLELSNPDKALLFTQVRMEARPRVGMQPRQDRGYGIARNYSQVNDDGSLADAKDLRVGDRVLVTLQIEVRQPAHYLAVDDPLPSIFEAVNPNFKSQASRASEQLSAGWREWRSSFHELREDRALFFADHIAPGNYTIRYLARVRAAGSATAPGAKVEEMYHPERFGITESVPFTSATLE